MDSQSPKKKKNDHSYTPYIIGCGVVVGVIALFLFAGYMLVQKTGEVFSDSSRDYSGEEARPSIEEALKITLPDSVSNMRFFYTAWLALDMRMKFDLAPDDILLLLDDLSAMCFKQPLQDGLNPFTTSPAQGDWWQPSTASDVIGAKPCGENTSWSLMIDRSNADKWTVYIEASSS